jgi:hypothetical protein
VVGAGRRYHRRDDDVLLLVAVEVAKAEAVSVAAIGYDVSLGRDFSIVATNEASALATSTATRSKTSSSRR